MADVTIYYMTDGEDRNSRIINHITEAYALTLGVDAMVWGYYRCFDNAVTVEDCPNRSAAYKIRQKVKDLLNTTNHMIKLDKEEAV